MKSVGPWMSAQPSWTVARFRDCVFDREKRELLHAGVKQPVGRWVIDALLHLIDHRDRIVLKSELAKISGRPDGAGDAAVARGIMKIRKAVGDARQDAPIVRTEHGVGYRFIAEIALESGESKDMRAAQDTAADEATFERRIVVLPFQNDTLDGRLSWVPLGMASMLEAALKTTAGWGVVPLPDTLARLGTLPRPNWLSPGDSLSRAFGAKAAIIGRLSGYPGRYQLEFQLHLSDTDPKHGALVGSDPARMLTDAAEHLQRWMAAGCGRGPDPSGEIRADFFVSTFAMAVQRMRQCRYLEADNLLDVATEGDASSASFQFARAEARVMLGRPDAVTHIRTLMTLGAEMQQKDLLARAHLLMAIHWQQKGRPEDAAAACEQAGQLLDLRQHEDVAASAQIEHAHCLAQQGHPDARAVLARGSGRAERLGNRDLLSRSRQIAGQLAEVGNDWVGAIEHYGAAATLIRDLDGPAQVSLSTFYIGARAQLGQLAAAADAIEAVWADAQISGRQPDMGLAAGLAAHLYFEDRRFLRLVQLYGAVTRPGFHQHAASLVVARDAQCAALLLCLIADFDGALARLARACEAAAHAPMLLGWCERIRLRILLAARRFDEVGVACERVLKSVNAGDCDTRMRLWVERALAVGECFGDGRVDSALSRLTAVAMKNPICEAQAVASLDAAWIHLERNDLVAARRLVEPLAAWLAQTPAGLQVDARIHYAAGDTRKAAQLQQQFLTRYAECATDAQKSLLDLYRGRRSEEDAAGVLRFQEPLSDHLKVNAALVREVKAVLEY